MRRSTFVSLPLPFFFFAFVALLASCIHADRSSAADDSPEAQPPNAEATRDGETGTSVDGSRADATANVPPPDDGPPRVDLIGRFDTRDSAGPRCGWPGCRIVARFFGTRVSARLREIAEDWMKGGPSEWDVAIDGAWQPKIVLDVGTKDYVLATGLPQGVHTVELYKRSEAQNGTTQFLGYDFADGALRAPPQRRTRNIEIIGDSAASGFGVEGVGQGPMCPGLNYAAKWENFRRSFGAVLGQKLDADVYGTVYSGKGLVKNIWRADKDTMPLLFGRALPIDPASTWSFPATDVPDVVLVIIGGNDFAIGQPVDDGPATLAQFTEAYDALVGTLHEKYPAAQVFLVTSTSLSDAQPPDRYSRTNVQAGIDAVIARRAGDALIHAIAPPVATPAELTGCEGHGSPELHQRIAADIAPVIRAKTGW